MGLTVVLLTGVLWVTGAILQWYNIRRQERLILRLRRLSRPRQPVAVAVAADAPELVEEAESVGQLRPAERWSVG